MYIKRVYVNATHMLSFLVLRAFYIFDQMEFCDICKTGCRAAWRQKDQQARSETELKVEFW